MSGRTVASYAISAAATAVLRERQRRQQVLRLWQVRQDERARLCAELASAAHRLGEPATRPALLPSLRSMDTTRMEQALVDAAAETAALRAELSRMRAQLNGFASALTAPGRDLVAKAHVVVARIDPDADVPPQISVLVEEITRAPTPKRALLLALLRDKVRALNETARQRRAEADLLEEVCLLAEETGDAELKAEALVARSRHVHGRRVDQNLLRRRAHTAAQRQLAEWRRDFTLAAVAAAFAEQDRHAVEIDVDDEFIRMTGDDVATVLRALPRHGVTANGNETGRHRDSRGT